VGVPTPDPDTDIDLSLRSFDYVLLASLAVVASVVSTSTVHQVINVELPQTESGPIRSIAVMPFENLTVVEGTDFFSDGLTEETISLMADLGEIRVAARSSTFYYKDQEYSVAEVSESLAVDALLEGSVRRQDNNVRIAVQLVDGATESILWTGTYTRHLEDIFAIQTDIARQVTGALEIVLSSRSESRLQRTWSTDPEAYDAYLMGREFLRRENDQDNFQSAVERFDSAIKIDAGFASAHAGMCEARLGQYELSRDMAYFEQAEAACLRALTRDSEATDTYLALAYLHFFAGQHDQSELEFKHVIDLNPTLPNAYLGLARNYELEERPGEAETAFAKAIEVDEGYWNSYQLFGNFLFGQGRYAEAANNYREVIKRKPSYGPAYGNLGAAYYMAGDLDGAAEAYETSLTISPNRSGYSNTGTMYYYLGDFIAAAEMYRKALELAPDDGRMWGNLGDALRAGAGSQMETTKAYSEARDLTRSRLNINPGDAEAMAELAYFSARLGDMETAKEMLRASIHAAPDDMYTHYYAALIYEQAGRDEEAFESLAKALELGYQPMLLGSDPGLKRYSGLDRFNALVTAEVGNQGTGGS
jgi:TolB-like protein/Tfp pilus assembly protein PilF